MKLMAPIFPIFMTVFALVFSNAFAEVPESELQEVRYAKAELAMIDGNDEEAMRILKQNLSLKSLHLPSFMMIADYHFRRRNFSKGMRVYHYLIKKLHSDLVMKSTVVEGIGDLIDDLPAPSQEVRGLYFRVGMEYYRMSENPDFDVQMRKKMLLYAEKYFNVCEFYKFNIPQTKYMLGIIKNRKEDFFTSIKYLADAKELLNELPDDQRGADLFNLDYLMGDNLVRAGFSDSGSLYLKSVYQSKNADNSLKDYASTYLNALNQEFFSISMRMSYGYNSNIEGLTESEQALRDRFSSSFPYIKDAYFSGWGVNSFYNSKKFDHWSFLLYGDVDSKNMKNKNQSTNDERTITGSIEAKYDNFQKSTFKTSLTYAYSMYRADENLSMEKLSNFYSIQPSYIYTLKRGIITYRAPLNITQSISEGNLYSYGLGISYSPFIKNKYWGLSYSLDFARSEEGASYPKSANYSLGVTNNSSFDDQNSLFTTFNYSSNNNSLESLIYTSYSLNMSHTLTFKKIRGLSLSLSLGYESTKYKTKDQPILSTEVIGGMSYSF
jgi:hypothetical protein